MIHYFETDEPGLVCAVPTERLEPIDFLRDPSLLSYASEGQLLALEQFRSEQGIS